MQQLEHLPSQPAPADIQAQPAYSTDLVPLTYDRAAFNALPHFKTLDGRPLVYHTNLEHHNDALTATDAHRINSHYEIELNLGTHGLANLGAYVKPTQKEYEAVWDVVDRLQPGDVLFVERYGFERQPADPAAHQALQGARQYAAKLMLQEGMDVDPATLKDMTATNDERIKNLREDYMADAWEYATELALSKGIEVVYADADAFMNEKMTDMANGASQLSQLASTDPETKARAKRVQSVRDKQARNVVKDWALQHLPPETEGSDTAGRKRKLAVLFGSAHAEGLETAFDQLHLGTTINRLPESTMEERTAEHRARLEKRWRDLPGPGFADVVRVIGPQPAKTLHPTHH